MVPFKILLFKRGLANGSGIISYAARAAGTGAEAAIRL
jgi:hypothetical protein